MLWLWYGIPGLITEINGLAYSTFIIEGLIWSYWVLKYNIAVRTIMKIEE